MIAVISAEHIDQYVLMLGYKAPVQVMKNLQVVWKSTKKFKQQSAGSRIGITEDNWSWSRCSGTLEKERAFLFITEESVLMKLDVGVMESSLVAGEIVDGTDQLQVLEQQVVEFFVFPSTKDIITMRKDATIAINHLEVAGFETNNKEIQNLNSITAFGKNIIVTSASKNKTYNHFELFEWTQNANKAHSVVSISKLVQGWKSSDDEIARTEMCMLKGYVVLVAVRQYGYFDLIGIYRKNLIILKTAIPGILTAHERKMV